MFCNNTANHEKTSSGEKEKKDHLSHKMESLPHQGTLPHDSATMKKLL
jgi:hypothetical protein